MRASFASSVDDSLVYLGVSGFGAYHYLLRGEEIAAHEKDNQLNRLDETYQLSQTNPEVASQIRTELGASLSTNRN